MVTPEQFRAFLQRRRTERSGRSESLPSVTATGRATGEVEDSDSFGVGLGRRTRRQQELENQLAELKAERRRGSFLVDPFTGRDTGVLELAGSELERNIDFLTKKAQEAVTSPEEREAVRLRKIELAQEAARKKFGAFGQGMILEEEEEERNQPIKKMAEEDRLVLVQPDGTPVSDGAPVSVPQEEKRKPKLTSKRSKQREAERSDFIRREIERRREEDKPTLAGQAASDVGATSRALAAELAFGFLPGSPGLVGKLGGGKVMQLLLPVAAQMAQARLDPKAARLSPTGLLMQTAQGAVAGGLEGLGKRQDSLSLVPRLGEALKGAGKEAVKEFTRPIPRTEEEFAEQQRKEPSKSIGRTLFPDADPSVHEAVDLLSAFGIGMGLAKGFKGTPEAPADKSLLRLGAEKFAKSLIPRGKGEPGTALPSGREVQLQPSIRDLLFGETGAAEITRGPEEISDRQKKALQTKIDDIRKSKAKISEEERATEVERRQAEQNLQDAIEKDPRAVKRIPPELSKEVERLRSRERQLLQKGFEATQEKEALESALSPTKAEEPTPPIQREVPPATPARRAFPESEPFVTEPEPRLSPLEPVPPRRVPETPRPAVPESMESVRNEAQERLNQLIESGMSERDSIVRVANEFRERLVKSTEGESTAERLEVEEEFARKGGTQIVKPPKQGRMIWQEDDNVSSVLAARPEETARIVGESNPKTAAAQQKVKTLLDEAINNSPLKKKLLAGGETEEAANQIVLSEKGPGLLRKIMRKLSAQERISLNELWTKASQETPEAPRVPEPEVPRAPEPEPIVRQLLEPEPVRPPEPARPPEPTPEPPVPVPETTVRQLLETEPTEVPPVREIAPQAPPGAPPAGPRTIGEFLSQQARRRVPDVEAPLPVEEPAAPPERVADLLQEPTARPAEEPAARPAEEPAPVEMTPEEARAFFEQQAPKETVEAIKDGTSPGPAEPVPMTPEEARAFFEGPPTPAETPQEPVVGDVPSRTEQLNKDMDKQVREGAVPGMGAGAKEAYQHLRDQGVDADVAMDAVLRQDTSRLGPNVRLVKGGLTMAETDALKFNDMERMASDTTTPPPDALVPISEMEPGPNVKDWRWKVWRPLNGLRDFLLDIVPKLASRIVHDERRISIEQSRIARGFKKNMEPIMGDTAKSKLFVDLSETVPVVDLADLSRLMAIKPNTPGVTRAIDSLARAPQDVRQAFEWWATEAHNKFLEGVAAGEVRPDQKILAYFPRKDWKKFFSDVLKVSKSRYAAMDQVQRQDMIQKIRSRLLNLPQSVRDGWEIRRTDTEIMQDVEDFLNKGTPNRPVIDNNWVSMEKIEFPHYKTRTVTGIFRTDLNVLLEYLFGVTRTNIHGPTVREWNTESKKGTWLQIPNKVAYVNERLRQVAGHHAAFSDVHMSKMLGDEMSRPISQIADALHLMLSSAQLGLNLSSAGKQLVDTTKFHLASESDFGDAARALPKGSLKFMEILRTRPEELQNRGISTEASIAKMLGSIAGTSFGSGVRAGVDVLMTPIQTMDLFVRGSSYYGALDIWLQGKLSPDVMTKYGTAHNYAIDVANKVAVEFSRASSPLAYYHPIGRLLFQYMQVHRQEAKLIREGFRRGHYGTVAGLMASRALMITVMHKLMGVGLGSATMFAGGGWASTPVTAAAWAANKLRREDEPRDSILTMMASDRPDFVPLGIPPAIELLENFGGAAQNVLKGRNEAAATDLVNGLKSVIPAGSFGKRMWKMVETFSNGQIRLDSRGLPITGEPEAVSETVARGLFGFRPEKEERHLQRVEQAGGIIRQEAEKAQKQKELEEEVVDMAFSPVVEKFEPSALTRRILSATPEAQVRIIKELSKEERAHVASQIRKLAETEEREESRTLDLTEEKKKKIRERISKGIR